jgi:DNA repair exonuclease SbcCD nuclease subunit
MRIVHLADTHLGFRQFAKLDPSRNLNQRECDVYDRWKEAIATAVRLSPDVVIHAGDLFDSSRPAPRAVAEALDGFKLLRDANIPLVVIAGNHETPRFRSGGSVFEILERFGVEAVWAAPRTIRVGPIAVHAVPHEPAAERLAKDIESLSPDPKADANILVVHAGLEAIPRQGYGEVNEIELDPEVLARARHDYIALGHLHRYQAPQLNAAYAGSLERLDFGDADGDKALLEIDLDIGAGKSGFIKRHLVRARPVFDFSVPCHDLSPGQVTAAVKSATDNAVLDDALVRVRLEGIARDVYQSLDRDTIADIFESCFHYQLAVGRSGLTIGDEEIAAEVSFEDFARERMPKDVDSEVVIALARRYLDDAAAEEAELEAEAG